MAPLCAALLVLLRSSRRVSPDRFGLGELHSAGLSAADRHHLIRAGLLRSETKGGRRGKEVTWFSLTDAGVQAAERAFQKAVQRQRSPAARPAGGPNGAQAPKPHWDRARRKLFWGSILVKAYRNPAPDQEAVLDAFEAAGWPLCIPSPLPHLEKRNAKVHLHEAIQSLNRRQQRPLLRFGGTGTGELGVRWRYVGDP